MRICYIADAVSIHTQRWVKYFADRGHEVHLISPMPLGDGDIGNAKLHVLKRFPLQVRIVSFLINLLSYIIQIKQLIREIKPDILHAHYITDCGFWGALSGFHPFVLSAWGSDILVEPRKSRVLRYFVRYALKRADVITTTTAYMRNHIIGKFEIDQCKIVTIPWGMDLGIFHRGYEDKVKGLKKELEISQEAPLILSNRAMKPLYRIQDIVECIPLVLEQFPDAIFVFLKGTGLSQFEDKMKLEVEKLGVSNNVRFISKFITTEEMAIYVNATDICISIPDSDQFGITIFEGVSGGAIPIVSDLETYQCYLRDGENAFFVPRNQPEILAQKIIHCLGHPELKNRFYQLNQRIVEENVDWNKNAGRMVELYENVADTRLQK